MIDRIAETPFHGLSVQFDEVAKAQSVTGLADALSALARAARKQGKSEPLVRIVNDARWLRNNLLSCLYGISQVKNEIKQLRAITGGLQ
jgi:hypothetical protein